MRRLHSHSYQNLPSLAAVPVIDILLCSVLLVAIPLLDFSFQLIALACDDVQIIISEFPPLLLNLPLYLLPVAFDAVPTMTISF